MKLLYNLSSLILLVLSSLILYCCSNDEPQAPGSSSDSENAITAELRKYCWESEDTDYIGGDDWVDLDIEKISVYFLTDDMGLIRYSCRSIDNIDGYEHKIKALSFSYYTDNSDVIITIENTEGGAFTLRDGLLYPAGSELPFYPRGMTSNDWTWINENKPISGKCGDNLEYFLSKENPTIFFTGSGDMYDYTPGKQPWAGKHIKRVEMCDKMTSVGDYAFDGMLVDDVLWSTSLKKIGKCAFRGTLISKLETWIFSDEIVSIGEESFANCKYLEVVSYIEKCNKLQEIGAGAFNGCEKLSFLTLKLPAAVKRVGDFAFFVDYVREVKLNDGLEEIGTCAFSGISKRIVIPSSVKKIGNLAFEGSFTEFKLGVNATQLMAPIFASTASNGKFYSEQKNPPTVSNDIVAETQSKWTLYVPKGSKNAYSKAAGWKGFKTIYEDNTLGNEDTYGSSYE